MLFEVCMSCLNYFSYVVLLSVIGCRFSRTFAYYTKQVLIQINLALAALAMYAAGNLLGIFSHGVYSTAVISFKVLEPLLYWFELEYEVQAPEKFDKKKPYIVVMNHQHSLDSAAAGKVWPYLDNRCKTIIKEELNYPLLGRGMEAGGGIFIDRSAGDQARETLNQAGREAATEEHSLLVFPEGTRSINRGVEGIQAFKKGAFHVAVDNQLPVLPVVVSRYDFIDAKKRRFATSGTVTVRILDPISTEGMDRADVSGLTESVRSKMQEAFEEISVSSDEANKKDN